MNVVDKLPKRLWPEARQRLREVWSAPTKEACEVRRDETALALSRDEGPDHRAPAGTYGEVNDSHFVELLAEREGIVISRESLRGILRASGIAIPRRHGGQDDAEWRRCVPRCGR